MTCLLAASERNVSRLALRARSGRRRQNTPWADRIGHVPAVEMHSDMVTRVLMKLETAGAAPATLSRHLSAISRVLQIAVRDGRLLEIKVTRELSRRAEPHGRDRSLDQTELEAPIAAREESSSAVHPGRAGRRPGGQ